jgi:uncharacterized protein YeaO (DUF488 family)
MVKISKTVYGKRDPEDGVRILVMRLWPRGVKKESIDEWVKELGTSLPLIKEWKAGRLKWTEFRIRYLEEMDSPEKRMLLKGLSERAGDRDITLLCSCRESNRCHRAILKEIIEGVS